MAEYDLEGGYAMLSGASSPSHVPTLMSTQTNFTKPKTTTTNTRTNNKVNNNMNNTAISNNNKDPKRRRGSFVASQPPPTVPEGTKSASENITLPNIDAAHRRQSTADRSRANTAAANPNINKASELNYYSAAVASRSEVDCSSPGKNSRGWVRETARRFETPPEATAASPSGRPASIDETVIPRGTVASRAAAFNSAWGNEDYDVTSLPSTNSNLSNNFMPMRKVVPMSELKAGLMKRSAAPRKTSLETNNNNTNTTTTAPLQHTPRSNGSGGSAGRNKTRSISTTGGEGTTNTPGSSSNGMSSKSSSPATENRRQPTAPQQTRVQANKNMPPAAPLRHNMTTSATVSPSAKETNTPSVRNSVSTHNSKPTATAAARSLPSRAAAQQTVPRSAGRRPSASPATDSNSNTSTPRKYSNTSSTAVSPSAIAAAPFPSVDYLNEHRYDNTQDCKGHRYTIAEREKLLRWMDFGALRPSALQLSPSAAAIADTDPALYRKSLPSALRQEYVFDRRGVGSGELAGETVELHFDTGNLLTPFRARNRPDRRHYYKSLPLDGHAMFDPTTMKKRRPKTPRSFYGPRMPDKGDKWFRTALDHCRTIESPNMEKIDAEDLEEAIRTGVPIKGMKMPLPAAAHPPPAAAAAGATVENINKTARPMMEAPAS